MAGVKTNDFSRVYNIESILGEKINEIFKTVHISTTRLSNLYNTPRGFGGRYCIHFVLIPKLYNFEFFLFFFL